MGESILLHGMNPMINRREAVQRFVDSVLKDGKPRGRAMVVSTTPSGIYSDFRNKGMFMRSDHIVLPDKTVLKYRDHPKKAKNATLPFKEFWKLANIVSKPKNIFLDIKKKNWVYLCASRASDTGKVVKVVIEPNYRFKGKTVNAITSIGVIQKVNMFDPSVYLKIK